MFCSQCGKEINDGLYCQYCGSKQVKPEHKNDEINVSVTKENDLQDLNKEVVNINLTPTMGVSFRRVLSFIIDFILLFAILLIFELSMKNILNDTIEIIIFIIAATIYFTYMESSSYQGSVGKIITGIIVTDYEGNRLTLKKSFIRTIAKLAHLFLVVAVVGGLISLMVDKHIINKQVQKLLYTIINLYLIFPIFMTKRKQSVHDYIVKTLVIKKPKKIEIV